MVQARLEIFMAMKIQVAVFWVTKQCGAVKEYQCFRGLRCHDLQDENFRKRQQSMTQGVPLGVDIYSVHQDIPCHFNQR